MAAINITCSSTSISRMESLKQPTSWVGFSFRGSRIVKDGTLFSRSVGSNAVRNEFNGEVSEGIEIQSDSVILGTLAADMAPTTSGLPAQNDEFNLDLPSEGFSTIPEAMEDICQGKMAVVVDDEDRENEGDLLMAASKVTSEAIAFILKHGTGIVCVSMKDENLERLQLLLMVTDKENDEKLLTAFTVSVGDVGDGLDILVRVHSKCLTGDIFGSARCDFGNQLALAMHQIEANGHHQGHGLAVAGRVPFVIPITRDNERYLDTNRAKMVHVYGLDANGRPAIISNRSSEAVSTTSATSFTIFSAGPDNFIQLRS